MWTYDFIHDGCQNGRKLKLLTVVDEFTRECLAIEVETSLPSKKVIAVLERLTAEHDAPQFMRSDNGPEFIAKLVKRWLAERSMQTLYIDPGSPWQNAFGESFHSRLRDECLSMEVFAGLAEARVVIGNWRREYNQERPHSSLDYLTPVEFKARWQEDHAEELPAGSGLSRLGPPDGDDAEAKEQKPGLPSPCSPSVRPPTRRSGCSPAEPYPPNRQTGVYHHSGEEAVLPTDGDVP